MLKVRIDRMKAPVQGRLGLYRCPSCDKVVDERRKDTKQAESYCWYCGQHLNWQEAYYARQTRIEKENADLYGVRDHEEEPDYERYT